MKKFIVFLLIATNVATLAAFGLYYRNSQAQEAVDTPIAPVVMDQKSQVSLPVDAVKISECIPFMGEHWAEPRDLPLGPYYVVHNSKVVALEYMFSPDKIPGEQASKMSAKEITDYMTKNKLTLADLLKANNFQLPLKGKNYTFLTLDWNSPHSGITVPHMDLHAYFIDEAEARTICPDAQLQDVYSPEVMDNIKKYKIPFPGLDNNK